VTRKTQSETMFETFCSTNGLDCEAIPTGTDKTTDYRVRFGNCWVAVEIEQIESDAGLDPDGSGSRVVGSHVRRKIAEARKQVQIAAQAVPTILLIHNVVDPYQAFGTENHDFVCAMYGEWTVRLVDGRVADSFHGRNAMLREDVNTSFSAVGHLKRVANGAEVTLFENVYARQPLPFAEIPSCIKVFRVDVEHAA